jgi:hypothetical protein
VAEGDSWRKEHAGVVVAAIITGVSGVVVAIITGIFVLASNDSSGGGSTTTTPQPTPSTSPPPTTSSEPADCNQQFQVTQPANGTRISASQGVILEGTACESDLIWVFDYDPTEGSYFQVNTEPLHIVGGQWVQADRPIGDPGDTIGTVYPIIVMKVTPACSDQLEAAVPDEDDTVWFNPLPPGCPTFQNKADTRSVDVVNAGP